MQRRNVIVRLSANRELINDFPKAALVASPLSNPRS